MLEPVDVFCRTKVTLVYTLRVKNLERVYIYLFLGLCGISDDKIKNACVYKLDYQVVRHPVYDKTKKPRCKTKCLLSLT